MTIFPSASAWTIRSVEMFRIRALVWKLSVTRPIWAPVKLIAGTPRLSMAMAMRATLTCSPVERSMSISRAGGAVGDLLGQRDQLIGRVPRAETTTSTCSPAVDGPGSPAAPRPGSCPNRRRWSRRISARATTTWSTPVQHALRRCFDRAFWCYPHDPGRENRQRRPVPWGGPCHEDCNNDRRPQRAGSGSWSGNRIRSSF